MADMITGRPIYIFFDESGDLDFSDRGTKNYILTAAIILPPFTVDPCLHEYKYKVREYFEHESIIKNRKKNNFSRFHASQDVPHVRKNVYEIINKNSGYAYYDVFCFEKHKYSHVKSDVDFYKGVYSVAIAVIVDYLSNIKKKDFVFLIDRKPVRAYDQILIKEIKSTIKDFQIKDGLHKNDINYSISFEDSSQHYGLQIADYVGYAAFQKIERNNIEYLNMLHNIKINIEK